MPFSPVQSARKFSAVFGTTSANSSNTIRPTVDRASRERPRACAPRQRTLFAIDGHVEEDARAVLRHARRGLQLSSPAPHLQWTPRPTQRRPSACPLPSFPVTDSARTDAHRRSVAADVRASEREWDKGKSAQRDIDPRLARDRPPDEHEQHLMEYVVALHLAVLPRLIIIVQSPPSTRVGCVGFILAPLTFSPTQTVR